MFYSLQQKLVVWIIKAVQRWGPHSVDVLGKRFEVSPDVFNPRFYYTSKFMARHIHVSPDDRVLDMGTGSGIQAIIAGQTAARVTGVDINPEAVSFARKNTALNGLGEKVSIVEGDLFSPIRPGEQFNVILFTPPYLQGESRSQFDHALYDSDKTLLRRFFQEAGAYLHKEGYVQMLYSSIADIEEALAIAKNHGWNCRLMAKEKTVTETFVIYRVTPVDPGTE